jgi:hypothetical protein
MSNRLGTKAAAGILAAVAAGLALVAVPGALADVSVSDPAGDSGVAPDITGVSIKGDAHGNVALTVTMTQPQMNPDAIVVASFDTDSNPATGDRTGGLGADYFILADPGGFAFLGEVQAKVTFIHLTSTATVRVEPGKMTIGVNRSDLGDADRFQFAVESDLSDGNGITLGSDSAPNGPPYPEFQFPAAASLTLSVGKPGSAKGRPIAGRPFVVTAAVSRSDGVEFTSGAVSCKASVGRAAVRARGSAAPGAARCAITIPKNASGRTLRGTMTVSTEGAAPVVRAFSFKIR